MKLFRSLCFLSLGVGHASITGPVISTDFPDPSVIEVDGTWYAFATSGAGLNVRVATSADFATWTVIEGHDAMPSPGSWAAGNVWAPDVSQLDDGSFVLYYAATSLSDPQKRYCIGVGISQQVLGPYTASTTEPFACPIEPGGAIDPDGFLDPETGFRYVVYKVDGNSIGHGGNCNNGVAPIVPTPIMLQRVDGNGYSPLGTAIQILDRSDADGPLVEAPSLVRSADGVYVLFFSSNCYSGSLYDVSYATSQQVDGPYTKSSAPLLVTTDGPNLLAPGGADVSIDGTRLVFHADVGGNGAQTRGMYTAEISIQGTSVTI